MMKHIKLFEDFLNEGRTIEKIEKDRTQVINDMAKIVTKWSAAKQSGNKEAEADLLQTLKDLTAEKKELGIELNQAIAGKDRDIELVISETVVNEDYSKLSSREKQLSGELSQVIFSYKNLKKEEKLNAVNSIIARIESGDLSESINKSTNEAQNFNVKDLPKGAVLTFKDGETWMVTKVIGNSSNPQGYLLAPHGKTKEYYISMQIEFSIKKLEDDLVSVN